MLTHDKVKTVEELREIIDNIRSTGGTSVFTNGCFDVLHPGHVQYLEKSRKLGDVLIIGLNSDSSIRAIKGPTRPIIEEDSRAYMLASLSCVDYVVLFEEDTPTNLLAALKPNILIKGADWEGKKLPGSESVDRVEFMAFLDGWSSTDVISRIRSSLKDELKAES